MSIETLEREGRSGNLTPAALEVLERFSTPEELQRALDSATGHGPSVIGDDSIRRAYAVCVFLLRADAREKFPKLDHDEAESQILMEAFTIMANYSKSKTPRTPQAYKAYVKQGINYQLIDQSRKQKQSNEVPYEEHLDPSFVEELPQHSMRELIVGFLNFFPKLDPSDQLLLTPLSAEGVPVEQWTPQFYTTLEQDRANLSTRLNQLSQLFDVHPADLDIRQQNLLCLFKSFLVKGNDAFVSCRGGAGWTRENTPGPKRQSGGIGTRNPNDSHGSDGSGNGKPTKPARRRDNVPWACKSHQRFSGKTAGVK